jgi:hypothetical protein
MEQKCLLEYFCFRYSRFVFILKPNLFSDSKTDSLYNFLSLLFTTIQHISYGDAYFREAFLITQIKSTCVHISKLSYNSKTNCSPNFIVNTLNVLYKNQLVDVVLSICHHQETGSRQAFL